MDATRTDETLDISAVQERTGIPAQTLRYWERAGLLAEPPERTTGGKRRYSPLDLERVRFVMKCRAIDMPIRDIARYVALLRQGEHTADERRAILEAHRDRVRTQIDEATKALADIEAKIETYHRRTP